MRLVDIAKNYIGYSLYYITALILITSIYVVITSTFQIPLGAEKVILLATSPFNSGVEQRYLNNVILAFVEIAFIEIYFTARNRRKLIKWSFESAILSSYLTAFLYIIITGSPSAGSSIIAASLLAFAFLAVISDLADSVSNFWKNRPSNYWPSFIRAIGYLFLIMVIPIFAYGAFFEVAVVGRISVVLHVVGITLFFTLIFCFYRLFGNKTLFKQPKRTIIKYRRK